MWLTNNYFSASSQNMILCQPIQLSHQSLLRLRQEHHRGEVNRRAWQGWWRRTTAKDGYLWRSVRSREEFLYCCGSGFLPYLESCDEEKGMGWAGCWWWVVDSFWGDQNRCCLIDRFPVSLCCLSDCLSSVFCEICLLIDMSMDTTSPERKKHLLQQILLGDLRWSYGLMIMSHSWWIRCPFCYIITETFSYG